MKKLTLITLALVATLAKADPVLLDRSPDAYPTATLLASNSGNWANSRDSQHFADSFSFASGEVLTGMGLYSGSDWGSLGQTVTIQLWADNAGTPGLLLNEFQESISVIDTNGSSSASLINQKYVDFTNPLNLAGSTLYWISMSGGDGSSYSELAMLGLSGSGAPDDGRSFQISGNTPQGFTPVGDASMRLYGHEVPEGGLTVSLLGVAMIGLVSLRRKLAA